ncbi:hypothetical protein ACKWTF_004927 [Chironomus riparius]
MEFQKAIIIFLALLSNSVLSNSVGNSQSYVERRRKIAGGAQPGRNEFLYKTAIYLYKTTTGVNFCSGSIITENFVLTAAHCFPNVHSGTIIAGVHDLQNEDPVYEWDFETSHIIIHENYIEQDFLNDIALIDVSSNPFVLSSKIQKIKIAPSTLNLTEFIGKNVSVAGWGMTSDNNQEMSDKLMYFNPIVLRTEVCRQVFGYIKVTSNSICLDGSDGRSTCRGDSGGGLDVMYEKEKILIGIVSFGLEAGCQQNYPTVSTFISPFYNWINTKVGMIL